MGVLLLWLTFNMYSNSSTINTRNANEAQVLPVYMVFFHLSVIVIHTNIIVIWYLKALVYVYYLFLVLIFANDSEHETYIIVLIGFPIVILLICH